MINSVKTTCECPLMRGIKCEVIVALQVSIGNNYDLGRSMQRKIFGEKAYLLSCTIQPETYLIESSLLVKIRILILIW